MQFEINNLSDPSAAERPVRLRDVNPIRLGNAADVEVRLKNPAVGRELGSFLNDGKNDGWLFISNTDLQIRVTDVDSDKRERTRQVFERGQQLRVAGSVVKFKCGSHYEITLTFDPDELPSSAGDIRPLEVAASELVIKIHRSLNEALTRPGATSGDKASSEYLMTLERMIEDEARKDQAFPQTERLSTALGDHLAGIAVRAELTSVLIACSGEVDPRDAGEKESWSRLRIIDSSHEQNLKDLVHRQRLRLEADPTRGSLKAKMEWMKDPRGFWATWYQLIRSKEAPASAVRSYLALRRLKKEIKDLWYGFGPLEELREDPTITEIMVVTPNEIFIEKGGRLEDSGRAFLDDSTTEAIVQKIAERAGRVLNDELPLLDARMGDGSRVNAVHRSLALKGPCLTIRRFPTRRIDIKTLVEKYHALTPAVRNFLQAAVLHRCNIIISGGTNTGKTTMLNCLSHFIPDDQRIVTIEDTAELRLQKRHVVTLQARRKTSGQGKEVSIRDLVHNALRMRPDRIVVGECRGAEAMDMLDAMNTGHDGSLTTLHANSPAEAVLRLEGMCQMASPGLPVRTIHQRIASAVNIVVQLQAIPDEAEPEAGTERRTLKRVVEVAEYTGVDDDGVSIRTLFTRQDGSGPLRPTGRLPTFLPEMMAAGHVLDPLDLVREED